MTEPDRRSFDPDSAKAAIIGRYRRGVENLQTGVRIEGDPTFDLTVRRWKTEDLDAARHTSDLHPRDRAFVNLDLDLAQTRLGTASCGPGVLPQYELLAAPSTWSVSLIPDQGHGMSARQQEESRARTVKKS